MNILAPYSWIKAYLQTEVDPKTFAKEMSLIGNSVERQVAVDQYLGEQVVLGRVDVLKPHPNADALQLVEVTVGAGVHHTIVCGGDNLAVGQLVAVALPGATVSWHGEGDMVLKATKIRGEESFGMICAAEELGFPQLAKGKNIWDLSAIASVEQLGQPIARVLELEGDLVFDIEVTTNRPDCMSMVGQAREAYAAKLGMYEEVIASTQVPEPAGESAALDVHVEAPDLCPRYMAVALDVTVGPSPWWMQKRLLLAGAKPINNVVDVTNYVRLELGQPLHAFDYAKIADAQIVVRRAKDGEQIVALDEATYTLSSDMCVIADPKGPVAIGGVMGGAASGTYEGTTCIVLEAAAFYAPSIRKTWRALNLQSDSQALYEKGLSVELPAYALARAVALLQDVAQAQVVSRVQDVRAELYKPQTFLLRPERVARLMGADVSAEEQVGILERLGFVLSPQDAGYQAIVPMWRDQDIEEAIDLTEEIARVWGYHNLPSTLPTGVIPRREQDHLLAREEEIKDLLCGYGYTEVYANSFDDPEAVRKAGLDPNAALRVENPLAEDQALMRTSLVPSTLQVLSENQVHPTAAHLFALSRVYLPRGADLPEERSMLLVSCMNEAGGESLFREAKGVLEGLMRKYHAAPVLARATDAPAYLHPGRAANVLMDDVVVGVIGELHPQTQQAFGLDRSVCLLSLDLPALAPLLKLDPTYQEPPAFPGVYRDLAFVLDEGIAYAQVREVLHGAADLLVEVELFDVYRGTGVAAGRKSLAVHLTFRAPDRTLTSEEVDAQLATLTKALTTEFTADIRE